LNDFNLSEGEKLLMSFLVARGVAKPQYIVQQFSDIASSKRSIASQLFKIRHWEIRQGSFDEITNETVTWFVDPPYQFGGESYKYGSDAIDFCKFAEWCQSRNGQVIVCENTKSSWLPFHPMRQLNGAYSKTTEAIWSNLYTGFEVEQLSLF
jgi:16S rRNA G966 N2-methylase RsmD